MTSTADIPAMHPAAPDAGSTIAVAMSGGVDSSAVAALLQSQGHTLVGLTLQLWDQRRLAGHEGIPQQVQGRCCSLDDVYDARRVAEQLGIPYYVVNQQRRFEQDVVQPFVEEYLAGRTPIPCTLCNNHLKFDELLKTARGIGAERVATGHYARVRFDRGARPLAAAASCRPRQGPDLLPLRTDAGAAEPHAVSRWARWRRAPFARWPRSTGCALHTSRIRRRSASFPAGDYKTFLAAYLEDQGRAMPHTAGEMITAGGEVVGAHDGIHAFTVGQRKGVQQQLHTHRAEPFYVLGIEPAGNRVVVGREEELHTREGIADRVNWISIDMLQGADAPCWRRFVTGMNPRPATILPLEGGRVQIRFDDAQRAVTPGQSAVFFDGDVVVGGGWLCAA